MYCKQKRFQQTNYPRNDYFLSVTDTMYKTFPVCVSVVHTILLELSGVILYKTIQSFLLGLFTLVCEQFISQYCPNFCKIVISSVLRYTWILLFKPVRADRVIASFFNKILNSFFILNIIMLFRRIIHA